MRVRILNRLRAVKKKGHATWVNEKYFSLPGSMAVNTM